MPDAIGSILVGLLLAVVAVFLIDRNRRFLVGEEVRPEVRQQVLRQAPGRVPTSIGSPICILEFVGPGRLYLVASVDMAGDDVEHSLAVRLRQGGTGAGGARKHRGGRAHPRHPRRGVAAAVTAQPGVRSPAVSRSAPPLCTSSTQ